MTKIITIISAFIVASCSDQGPKVGSQNTVDSLGENTTETVREVVDRDKVTSQSRDDSSQIDPEALPAFRGSTMTQEEIKSFLDNPTRRTASSVLLDPDEEKP